jgi:hypothetical protein
MESCTHQFKLNRPAFTDVGYSDLTSGWYDAEGFGKAMNYCRYVGNRPFIWFSCVLVNRSGRESSPLEATPPGVFTETGQWGLARRRQVITLKQEIRISTKFIELTQHTNSKHDDNCDPCRGI